MKNKFNLIDEPWIPITEIGLVSLRDVFRQENLVGLGGNPIQKISLMKLLLAIAQAAYTPANDDAWKELGNKGLAERCNEYLDKWHNWFYLYGEKPFLQMPSISTAKKKIYGALIPWISSGNTTVKMHSQVAKEMSDPEKALLLITLMGFALGGKKVDNSISLSKGYVKKKSGKPGPSMAHMGLLHNFVFGETLKESVWLNLLTHENINSCKLFSKGLGTAPWESMPKGEDCKVAKMLKSSLMGRLVPLCRFCLLDEKGIHYSEGILHLNYLDGFFDPTIAINNSGKKPKVLWSDSGKRPWRQLPALLSFIKQTKSRFDCLQLCFSLPRTTYIKNNFIVWSGGLRVSSNAGEQYVSGSDDFVESEVKLMPEYIINEDWFNQLLIEMENLEGLGKTLYGSILNFYKTQKTEGAGLASNGTSLFWQLCENNFQNLVDACDNSEKAKQELQLLHQKFAGYIHTVYNQSCPSNTARQIDVWAKCRPNLSKYLRKEDP